jgi:type III pantothenate kinase
MDINLLTVNLGNTRAAIGAFVNGKLTDVQHVANDKPDELKKAVERGWGLVSDRPGASVAVASVNPQMDKLLEQINTQIRDEPARWVGREIDLPIVVLTDEPQQTGVDRVINIAAAYEQMNKACVVVDAGTAITIDCCDDRGNFLGGAIAAGVGIMLDGLHQRTARLPRVELDAPLGTFGSTTANAIQQGVFHGIRGMVKELVERYATELGSWPDIIATGGDAETLFGGWELIHAIAPDLTLYGIALAYSAHLLKHEFED